MNDQGFSPPSVHKPTGTIKPHLMSTSLLAQTLSQNYFFKAGIVYAATPKTAKLSFTAMQRIAFDFKRCLYPICLLVNYLCIIMFFCTGDMVAQLQKNASKPNLYCQL